MLEWVHTNYGLKITTMLENVLWFLDSPKQLISLEDQGRFRWSASWTVGTNAGSWLPLSACRTYLRETRNLSVLNQFPFLFCLLVKCMIGFFDKEFLAL